MLELRAARSDDLPRLVEIYNHYILHTPVTFDTRAQSVEERSAWFDKYAETDRHRLLVAVDHGIVAGYASSSQFRVKPAYDSTVETTVYCATAQQGRGIGRELYTALFAALHGEDITSYIAAITIPNAALADTACSLQLSPSRCHASCGPQIRSLLGRGLARTRRTATLSWRVP